MHSLKSATRKATPAIVAALMMAMALSGCGETSNGATKDSAGNNVTTVQAVTGASPAPYIFKDSNNQLTGQNYDLVNAIFKKLPKYKLSWNTTDFNSIFSGLDSGRYQIAVNNFARNKEREEKYVFSDPIYSETYVVEVAKNSKINASSITTLADLAGKSVLLEPGMSTATAIQNWNSRNPSKSITIKYTGTGADVASRFHQIESGQADFTIDDSPLFNYFAKTKQFDLRAIQGGPAFNQAMAEDANCYLLFPKGQDQLVKDVNKALKEVIADGTSTKLNQQWFGTDLTPKTTPKA